MNSKKEEKIQEAIRALEAGKIPSVRRAALFYIVPETTLRNIYKRRTQVGSMHCFLNTSQLKIGYISKNLLLLS